MTSHFSFSRLRLQIDDRSLTHGLGILIAGSFFVVGLFTARDYGITIDEWETSGAARVYADIFFAFLHGQAGPSWPFHVIPGYYFFIDLFRYVVSRGASLFAPPGLFVSGFHFSNLILSSLSLYLVFRISYLISKNSRASILSALSLALLPQFIAHSQNNPKDLIALFALVLGFFSFLYYQARRTRGSFIFGCLSLGVSWTSTPFSALIVPIFGVWLYLFRRVQIKILWRQNLLLILGGGLSAFLFWPWLWPQPVQRFLSLMHRISHFSFNIREVYLGKIYPVHQLPWHYIPSHFLGSVPTVFLLAVLLNIFWIFKGKKLESKIPALAGFAAVWLGVGLAISFNSELKYNGMRHFLFLAPALSLLIGTGFEALWSLLNQRAALLLAGLSFLYCLSQVIYMHPYEGAYLNEVVNARLPGPAESYFSVENLDQAYLEGSRWLTLHAEPDSDIIVPIHRHVANAELTRKSLSGSLDRFSDMSQVRYLMYITRRSRFTHQIHSLELEYEPVFEIRRQKATLLKIYKNNHRWSPGSMTQVADELPEYGK